MNPPSITLPCAHPFRRRKLPIGIQTFSEIIQEGHYCVDKSGFAVRMVNEGKYCFLSRPRRFGKSLFLDTLREMFEGNLALFDGIDAENAWDWRKKCPVIRISFGDDVLRNRAALDQHNSEILLDNQRRLSASCTHQSLGGQFGELIALVRQKTGQRAVVLIDEYDKPILDNIDHSAAAIEMREGLKNLYSVLKGSDEHLKFAFLAGFSKFSKISLFSGLNNLTDVTLEERYSATCGYTDADVDEVFAPELPGLDRELIRQWYNGYNWLGTPVYNPFGLLQLFRTRQICPHRFETGTPSFLIKLLQQHQSFTADLSRNVASESLLSTFDVDNIQMESLMFQAGYLTIADVWQAPGQMELTLKYPNLEVQTALNNSLLQSLTRGMAVLGPHLSKLYKPLMVANFDGLKNLFHAFYASIAYDWYRKNEMNNSEGFYVSIFYSYFVALELHIQLEDFTSQGCIDMTVLFNHQVFLFEFKVAGSNPASNALQQIKDKCYADKFKARGEPIQLIGVEFSKTSRNIVGFEVETLQVQ